VTYRPRFHEWAWGDVARRTVCGQTTPAVQRNTVSDLGNVAIADRCGNCERMRAAIGTSSKPTTGAAPIFPTIVGEADLAARAGEVTDRERHILEHSTGWLSRWPLYRNHFCAGPSHDDWPTIQALIERGLMKVSREPSELSGSDTVFCVTAIGIAALKRRRPQHAGEASKQAE
jgi:hypothetical protein